MQLYQPPIQCMWTSFKGREPQVREIACTQPLPPLPGTLTKTPYNEHNMDESSQQIGIRSFNRRQGIKPTILIIWFVYSGVFIAIRYEIMWLQQSPSMPMSIGLGILAKSYSLIFSGFILSSSCASSLSLIIITYFCLRSILLWVRMGLKKRKLSPLGIIQTQNPEH